MRQLLTVVEVRALDLSSALTLYSDLAVTEAIRDVSAACEAFTRHDFAWRPAEERHLFGRDTDSIDLSNIDPIWSVTSIESEYGGLVPVVMDHLTYLPLHGPPGAPPYDFVRWRYGWFPHLPKIIVTGNWGWQTIPERVQLTAFRLVKRYLTDDAFRAAYQGTATIITSESGPVSSITTGTSSMSVSFSSSQRQFVFGETLGDLQAEKILRTYRRRQQVTVV